MLKKEKKNSNKIENATARMKKMSNVYHFPAALKRSLKLKATFHLKKLLLCLKSRENKMSTI